jgi:hypothetical protein
MDELTIITGKVNLDTTYLKIKLSLEDIKEKRFQIVFLLNNYL